MSSLAKVEDDKQLGIARIPIRVILLATAPAGFGAEVTRTNNLQNRIEPRDFVAQDPEQKRLREEMAIEGVDYQVVRSEDVAATATTCELLEVTTALACASGDASLATQVKTGIGRFFLDLGKAPYKSIFNPSLSGARAFNSVAIQRRIDAWIENEKRTLSKKSGPAWGVLVHGNRILAAAAFKLFDLSKLPSLRRSLSVRLRSIVTTFTRRWLPPFKRTIQGSSLLCSLRIPQCQSTSSKWQ